MSESNLLEFERIKRLLGPQAIKDLDVFLDNLPIRAGFVPLAGSAFIWAIAALAILFTYMKSTEVYELQQELSQAEALRPIVPDLRFVKLNEAAVTPIANRISSAYGNVSIRVQRNGEVEIFARTTADFVEWRAAVDAFAYTEKNLRLRVVEMCAGRECSGAQLQLKMALERIDIQLPNQT